MNLPRFLLTPLILSLVACGSDCIVKKGFVGTNQITNETLARTNFYEQEPIKNFSGIKSIKINDSKLSLNLINQGFFYEYNAPIVKVTTAFHYSGDPAVATILTLASAGLYPLFAPRDFYERTFGCTSTNNIKSEIDKTRKITTGKSEWRDITKSHKILVSGFDKEYEFVIEKQESQPITIDLNSAILNTDFSKENRTIKATCLDCDSLSQIDKELSKDFKNSMELTYDFRPIKASLIEANTKIIEPLQSEKTTPKMLETTNTSEQTVDPVIEKAKETCSSLGFKKGTEKFGNCVLKLTK